MKKVLLLSALFFCVLFSSAQDLNNSGLIVSDLRNLEIKSTKISLKSGEIFPQVMDYSKGFQSEPFNQQPSGTCVACAIAHLETYQLGKLMGWNVDEHRISPAYIYNMNHKPGAQPGLSTLETVPNMLATGFLFENQMPFVPGDESRPGLKLQYEALKVRPTGWGFLSIWVQENKLDLIKKTMSDHGPLAMDMVCGSLRISHCVCMVGYNDTIKLSSEYTGGIMFMNSYGLTWKSSKPNQIFEVKDKPGYGWIPYKFLESTDWHFNFYWMDSSIVKTNDIKVVRATTNWKIKREDVDTWDIGKIFAVKQNDTLVCFNRAMGCFVEKVDNLTSLMGVDDDTLKTTIILNDISLEDLSLSFKKGLYRGKNIKVDTLFVKKIEIFNKQTGLFEKFNFESSVTTQSIFTPIKGYHDIPTFTVNLFLKDVVTSFRNINNNFNVYPNPTLGLVNLENAPLGSPISVYDTNGRTILRKTVDDQSTQIDLLAFPSGLYFVKVQNMTKKIIKK